MLVEYAHKSNFHLVTKKSDKYRLELMCSKGGSVRNTRNLTNEQRQRHRSSQKTNCPYTILCTIDKLGQITLKEQDGTQMLHSHSLTKESFCITYEGRKSNLTTENVRTLHDGIKNWLGNKVIQRSVSNGKAYNALHTHDIANMKAKQLAKAALPFSRSNEMALVEKMKSSNCIVSYKRLNEDYCACSLQVHSAGKRRLCIQQVG